MVFQSEYLDMSSEQPRAAPRVDVARQDDLAALVALEAASFSQDRISRRSWRRLVLRPSAMVLASVAAIGSGDLAGALVLLFRRRSRIARVYSIAVAASSRGNGVGAALLAQAGAAATRRGCTHLRLETRVDNRPAQVLFRREGFAETGRTEDYYQDGMAALRFERRL